MVTPSPDRTRRDRLTCRAIGAGGLLVLIVSVVALTRSQLQASDPGASSQYRSSMVRRVAIPGLRGTIYDRNGTPLNASVSEYGLYLYTEHIRNDRQTRAETLERIRTLACSLGETLGPRYLKSLPSVHEMERHLIAEPSAPLMLWRDLDRAALRIWALRRHDFPAVDVIPGVRRQVFFPDRAVALRGLVGTRDVVCGGTAFAMPAAPEEYGLSGVEEALNGWLSGRPGYQDISVDVFGYRHRVLVDSKALAGSDATLTIDIGIQCMAEHVLGDLPGAIVVMNGAGEILAMAGTATPVSSGSAGSGTDGSGQDRAWAGAYAPGSIVKPLVALAALEADAITPDATVDCTGYVDMGGGVRLHCARTGGHGPIALREALAESCNVYFADVVRRVGPDAVLDVMERVGIGRHPGTILVRGETEGVLSRRSRRRGLPPDGCDRDSVWYPEDTAHLAIGQGDLGLSPLQACAMTGAMLTGVYRTPQLLRAPAASVRPRELGFSESALAAVREGMVSCVESATGTGHGARVPGVVMAGKTGTARAVVNGALGTNAWMVAAVPANSPEYVISAFVEGGTSGSVAAAPLVGRLTEMILTRELAEPGKGLAMTP